MSYTIRRDYANDTMRANLHIFNKLALYQKFVIQIYHANEVVHSQNFFLYIFYLRHLTNHVPTKIVQLLVLDKHS